MYRRKHIFNSTAPTDIKKSVEACPGGLFLLCEGYFWVEVFPREYFTSYQVIVVTSSPFFRFRVQLQRWFHRRAL